ncbi:PaaX family transcriptional regulator C-terminal domain-containing protein [Pseudonocardia spinosispora]|uniref:PaaX family transcriptional regulator C-terminal domain-containing protein n=1 Tax=Pseudonocardia spinosispora TaxID=103441 RepID=UPI00042A8878|nr:PaaX family transcriptional regulator C-terminal domain-containing protein [Pseudonocardia spinosispora]
MNRERLAERLGIGPLSARSVALSALLGSHPPRLPARSLVALGSLFGIADGAMRTALSRMAESGEVGVDDAGYVLGERLRRRQVNQDAMRRAPTEPWDGTWWFAIVDAQRRPIAERRAFRSLMGEHRMAELRPEVWLRPANVAGPSPMDGTLVVRGGIDGRDPVELAGQLWDLPSIEAEAIELIGLVDEAFSWLDREDPAVLAETFLVSIAAVRFLRREPQLPSALVSPGWPAPAIRAAYDRLEEAHLARQMSFMAAAAET